MKKLLPLIFISIFVLGCEKSEPDLEPEIDYEAQRIKRFLETQLSENHIGAFMVSQKPDLDTSVMLIESENLSFDFVMEMEGLGIDVLFSFEESISRNYLYYQYSEIDNAEIEFAHPLWSPHNILMIILKDSLAID